MKRTINLIGIIVLLALVSFSFTSCDEDSGETKTEVTSMTFTSRNVNGDFYMLTIIKNAGKAAFTPSPGDAYLLTIIFTDGSTVTSSGVVRYNGGNSIMLSATADSSETFTVTIIDGKMTRIDGQIPVDGNEPVTGPGAVIPTDSGSIPVTSVSLNTDALSLSVGETEPLTAVILPSDASNKFLIWSSNAPSIASVSQDGEVTALAAGSATITVRTASGGKTATCNVIVTASSSTNQTPVAGDYTITGVGTYTYDGTQRIVSITPKAEKSPGTVTVYYSGSTTAPSAVGSYTVTFNVASATGWNAASGLSAGTLTINSSSGPNQTPIASDYNISGIGTFTADGTARVVSVTAKSGKSPGTVTVYYSGSTTAPSAAGTYTVTFNVAAATGWNAVSGLSAGTLIISSGSVTTNQTPVASDYNISGIGAFTADGTARVVTVTAKSGKSPGTVTVYYNGSTTAPSAAGTYTVTFNVVAATGWNAVSGLSAGTLIINANDGTPTFTSISAFGIWLNNQSSNTPETAYNVKLNVNNITGIESVLGDAWNKYVKIDLSGSTITSIPDEAFYGVGESLVGIVIPNSVTSIGDSAFFDCHSLTSITIPNSVTSIGDWAFSSCFSLASVTIGNGVTSIGYGAFGGCESLTSITIPGSVTRIRASAFGDCTSLSSITIPNSVRSIDEWAFSNCIRLSTVTIPGSVISIEGNVFTYCESLTAINVDSGNNAFTSENGVLYNKTKTTLITYPCGKTQASFTIPTSVTNIGYEAFGGCASLNSVTIPSSVTSIESYAFSYSGLNSVSIPSSVTSIGNAAFMRCSNLTSINVDSGNKDYSSENGVLYNKNKTYLHTYPNGKTGASYTIPSSVTSIRPQAFYSCSSLTNIIIPNSVTSIGRGAFQRCINLTSVTFQGIIPSYEFDINVFYFLNNSGPGQNDLRDKYLAGGIGTYTRSSGSNTWTKQP